MIALRFDLRRFLLVALVVGLVAGLPETVAAQQNVMVRPMRVEASVPANRTVRVNLQVTNRHATRTERVNVEAVELVQDRNGTLRLVEPDSEEAARMGPLSASNLGWLELPQDTIIVPPGTTVNVPVVMRVPFDAQGTYASAVILRTEAPPVPPPSGANAPEVAFTISFGFSVPLILTIEGRPVRQDIAPTGLAMEVVTPTTLDDGTMSRPSTLVSMEIANRGRTHSALRGEVVVEARSGSNWRTIARGALAERKILPGVTLELGSDLGRQLPSGEYRLIGNLFVDGRQMPRIERVVQFEGDPEADALAFETALSLEPRVLRIDGIPGATRATTLEVGNPGDLPLTLSFSLELPQGLRGVAMGELMGEELSAAEWSEVRPASVTIPPGQRRNVRVTSRLPREGLDQAAYYADIVIDARFPDGQSAGETRSSLRVRQEQVAAAPAGLIDRFGISIGEAPSEYILQARLVNSGNIEIAPQVTADLITAIGESVQRWRLSGVGAEMLPLAVRDLSGLADLSQVEPGDYTLLVAAEIDGRRIAERQIAIRVALADGEDQPRELIVLDQ